MIPPLRPARAERLKLYIDSTSLPLVHQMADFVACCEQPEVVKILTWLRLPMSRQQLIDTNSYYLPQYAQVSDDFIRTVCQLVQSRQIRQVEIHSNQYHAWRGVAPLLRQLMAVLPDARDAIRLELYDDGTAGMEHREWLKARPEPARLIAAAATELSRGLESGPPLGFDIAQSYAWHHLFETRYHLLRRDVLLRDAPGRALHACLDPYTKDMRFDDLPGLSTAQQGRYFELFGLDAPTCARLAPVADRDDALLFTGTAIFDKGDDLALRDRQLRAIAALRAGGGLPQSMQLCFKGHPANRDHHGALMAALGDAVVEYPAGVPLEVLMMAGLLPRHVAGMLSTSYCSLPQGCIEYVLCDKDAARPGSDASLVALMVSTGILDPERVLPLLQ